MEQITRDVIVVNMLAALATHVWLKRHDPVPIRRVLPVVVFVPLFTAWFQSKQRPVTPMALMLEVVLSYAIYYTTLSLSVVAYRLSPFHPLAKYPGPLILKVTKIYAAWIGYNGKYHIYLKSLHDKYGPVIRIGPNELSTTEKDLLPEVFGSQGMPKGPMWEGRRFAQTEAERKRNYDSLLDVRRSDIHAQLRKPWNRSFSAEPLQNYEKLLLPRVTQFNQTLKKIIVESNDGVGYIDIAKWIGFFSFDFMGDIAFGGPFEHMRDGDVQGQHQAMEDGMYLPSITQHIPWLNNTLRLIPALVSGVKRLNSLGVEYGIKRSTMEIKKKDLFYYMGESTDSSVPTLDMIIPNVILAIVAGSDTTASTMTNAVQLVISHPEAHKKLQREIDDAFNEHALPDIDADGEIERYSDVLAGLKFLNGVINEALRLFPAVPTGLQRAPAKDSGGRILQGERNLNIYLPEGNAICMSPYVMHRDPRHFYPQPDDFIPERWFSNAFKTSRDAFIPFSYGPRNCVGRPLALIEMRYAVATLFRNFKFELDTTKYNAQRWKNEIEDRFTFANGKLHVKMTLRTKEMRGLK